MMTTTCWMGVEEMKEVVLTEVVVLLEWQPELDPNRDEARTERTAE
jgi:hypothetical protein